MTDRLPRISMTLVLSATDLDFEELTRLGLPNPTTRVLRGFPRSEKGRTRALRSAWEYSLVKHSDEIEQPILELLASLAGARDAIREVGSRNGVLGVLNVSVSIFDDRPLYCLSAETLGLIASFGVELALDIFDYSDGDS